MPEIKFSNDKAERWLDRIEKRLLTLSPEDIALYKTLREVQRGGQKLDSRQAKVLWELGRRL